VHIDYEHFEGTTDGYALPMNPILKGWAKTWFCIPTTAENDPASRSRKAVNREGAKSPKRVLMLCGFVIA
jgi:hypothetical protein